MVLKLQASVFQDSRAPCPQICIPTVTEDRDILLHSLHAALPTARGCTPTRDTHARACTASIPTGTSRDPPATPLGTRLLLIGRHVPPRTPVGIISQARAERRNTQTLGSWLCASAAAARSSQLRPRPYPHTQDAPAPGSSGDRGNPWRPLDNPLPTASRERPSHVPSLPSFLFLFFSFLLFFFLSPFYPSFHPCSCSAASECLRSPLFVLFTPLSSDPGPAATARAHCNEGAREGARRGPPHSRPLKGRSLYTAESLGGGSGALPRSPRGYSPHPGPTPRTATTPRSPSGTRRPALSRARQGRAPPGGGT